MRPLKKPLVYGFFIWLIPFIISIFIFPLRGAAPALFKSIMPVVITVCAVAFSLHYFKKINSDFLSEGIWIGFLWLALSIILDLLLFMEGPMKMSLIGYIMDIGLTYLIIPIVVISMGYMLQEKEVLIHSTLKIDNEFMEVKECQL